MSAVDDQALADSAAVQAWWRDLQLYLPALKRAVDRDAVSASFSATCGATNSCGWVGMEVLTKDGLRQLARTMMVWLSWIHEDVGHAAAAFVYNPVHTPMCVPEDGEGKWDR